MANKLLSNIRYQKAHQRLLKKKYPTCPHLKRLLRLEESRIDLNKHIDFIWKQMFNKGFISGQDNGNPVFFDDFDKISGLEKERAKISKSIYKLEQKGYLLEDAQKTFSLLNTGRLSQSY